MKTVKVARVKVASKKILQAGKPRHMVGVQVRSGVKAGWQAGRGPMGAPELGGPGGGFSERF